MAAPVGNNAPLVRIDGEGVPGLPLTFPVCGDMAQAFEESYSVAITAKDLTEKGDVTGQRPHPPDMNFDHGQFDGIPFTIQLFSGIIVSGRQRNKGRELVEIAETLYRLAMPRSSGGNSFIGPPLVYFSYGKFWRARGLFQKVSWKSEGAFDDEQYPTLVSVNMEFSRHFGGGPNASRGGAYYRAEFEDLRKATAQEFSFRG